MAIPITRREQCLRNVKTLLEGITIANGYFTTIGLVERVLRGYQDPIVLTTLRSGPWLGFSPGVREVPDYFGGNLSHNLITGLIVTYISVASSGDSAGATTQADEVLSAWLDALEVRTGLDPTLSRYAIRFQLMGRTTNEGVIHDSGIWIKAAEIDFELEYERSMQSST